MTSVDEANDVSTRTTKIDRLVHEYGLDGMPEELEARWLGTDGEQASTRELASYFNKAVLEAAVDDGDVATLTGSVDDLYEAITTDDADATLVRSRLEQRGVDVEAVMDDFVSHQTVYRYLKNHRGVERSTPTTDERRENAIETIQRLRGRTTAVTEQTIENLQRADAVSDGEFSILNDLQVLCEQCGRSSDVATFLERGGCECQTE